MFFIVGGYICKKFINQLVKVAFLCYSGFEVIILEIRQLRSFLAVADTLNFSRAAQSLFLSQSALSRQIMDLEREIGLPLFERNTRRVELTEAGRQLLSRARELMERWDHLGSEVRDRTEGLHVPIPLSLGLDARVLTHPGRRLALMDKLAELRRDNPGLRILTRHLEYRELMDELSDRRLDCVLALDRPLEPRSQVEEMSLGQEEMVLVYRSQPSEAEPSGYSEVLARHGLVLVDKEPQGMHHIIRILDELGEEPRIHFCQSIDDMSMMTQCGECAAILPESVVAKLADPQLRTIHLPGSQTMLRRVLLWEKGQRHPLLPQLQQALQEVFEV